MTLSKIYHSFLPVILLLMLTGCPFEKEDEKPKEKARITHEFLQYVNGDPLRTKLWYGTSVEITSYRADGSVEQIEELVNYRAWIVRFSSSGPYTHETGYSWDYGEGVLDGFLHFYGRYELDASKNQITFGDFTDPFFSQNAGYEDIVFDVRLKEDFYLSDWLEFTHFTTYPDGRRIETSFVLSH